MLGKIEIFIIILFLVFLFYIVISFGAGQFSKNKKNLEVKKYLRSVNILLIFIAVIGTILIFFL
jgi:uncharacterized membrane protein YidH (DUF202 family)